MRLDLLPAPLAVDEAAAAIAGAVRAVPDASQAAAFQELLNAGGPAPEPASFARHPMRRFIDAFANASGLDQLPQQSPPQISCEPIAQPIAQPIVQPIERVDASVESGAKAQAPQQVVDARAPFVSPRGKARPTDAVAPPKRRVPDDPVTDVAAAAEPATQPERSPCRDSGSRPHASLRDDAVPAKSPARREQPVRDGLRASELMEASARSASQPRAPAETSVARNDVPPRERREVRSAEMPTRMPTEMPTEIPVETRAGAPTEAQPETRTETPAETPREVLPAQPARASATPSARDAVPRVDVAPSKPQGSEQAGQQLGEQPGERVLERFVEGRPADRRDAIEPSGTVLPDAQEPRVSVTPKTNIAQVHVPQHEEHLVSAMPPATQTLLAPSVEAAATQFVTSPVPGANARADLGVALPVAEPRTAQTQTQTQMQAQMQIQPTAGPPRNAVAIHSQPASTFQTPVASRAEPLPSEPAIPARPLPATAPVAQAQPRPEPPAQAIVQDSTAPVRAPQSADQSPATTTPLDPAFVSEGSVERAVGAVGPVHPQQVLHQIARQQAAAAQELADHVAMAEHIERMNNPQSLAERLLGSI